MNGLVNYESSDDDELAQNDNKGLSQVESPVHELKNDFTDENGSSLENGAYDETELKSCGLFENMPKPMRKFHLDVVEDELETLVTEKKSYEQNFLILPQNGKRKVQIIAHAFESEDSDSEDEFKQMHSNRNCGLLNLLPAPVNKIRRVNDENVTESCADRTVDNGSPTASDPLKNSFSLTDVDSSPFDDLSENSVVTEEHEESYGLIDSNNSDFFSLKQEVAIEPVVPTFDVISENLQTIRKVEKEIPSQTEGKAVLSNTGANDDVSLSFDLPTIPDELKKLCEKGQAITFADVRADEIIGDNKEMLLKTITDDSYTSYARSRVGMPNTLSKRKHQMTYLAYLAKEQEQDLKNMWAQNRMNKRESRMKYGF